MNHKTVFFQDVEMAEGWPERIMEAQKILTYTIAGQQYARVPYGKEPGGRKLAQVNCHDCAVIRGQFHVPTCDMERCPRCRGQVLSCGCVKLPRD